MGAKVQMRLQIFQPTEWLCICTFVTFVLLYVIINFREFITLTLFSRLCFLRADCWKKPEVVILYDHRCPTLWICFNVLVWNEFPLANSECFVNSNVVLLKLIVMKWRNFPRHLRCTNLGHVCQINRFASFCVLFAKTCSPIDQY